MSLISNPDNPIHRVRDSFPIQPLHRVSGSQDRHVDLLSQPQQMLVVRDDCVGLSLQGQRHEFVVVRIIGNDSWAALCIDGLGTRDPFANDLLSLVRLDGLRQDATVLLKNRRADEQCGVADFDCVEQLPTRRTR